jgi:tetratricopeptide (TPR) repeat protein
MMKVHNNLIVKLLFLILLFVNVGKLAATDAQQVFTTANQAYQSGNYRLAADSYESILQKGNVFSKELFFNLGNAYFRLNQIGLSILNYERALRLDPSDSEIQQNLIVARSRVSDDIEPITSVFFMRWWQQLRAVFPADTWSIFGLFFIWLGAAGFALWLLDNERQRKKYGFIVGSVAVPLSIVLFLLSQSAASVMQTPYGIVVTQETALRNAPDPNATIANTLHDGLKVEILDKIGSMTKVKLPNGEDGWLPATDVEKI